MVKGGMDTSLRPLGGGRDPGPHSLQPGPGAPSFGFQLSLVVRRRGRVCRRPAGLPRPGHAVQEPHRHLRLRLPPGHAAPARLRRGLHRYDGASGVWGPPQRRKLKAGGRRRADINPGGALLAVGEAGSGALASPPACLITPASDDDECRIQPSLCANGRCVNTAGSFRCDCDEGFEPSPALTVCHGECGQAPPPVPSTSWELPEVGPGARAPTGHAGGC